ncbi:MULTISPECIES: hypothetical protein [Bradyrhizobium]|uniref:hypothetical protein n=1 Tax=Bradyrhizobium TaxID=374 RepID=UPI001E64BFE6|nr:MULTISPECIES: hypothetical protein [Bradyrhizobium]UFW51195.1 hypothetical protein BaraCB756_09285 [Bradyrhizobium arachidis]
MSQSKPYRRIIGDHPQSRSLAMALCGARVASGFATSYTTPWDTTSTAASADLDWKLVTNLPVGDFTMAIEKLEWYALRWKAEVFHKVMKSGCRAEETWVETAERLTKFLALIAMVSWRIFFLTMSAQADAAGDSPHLSRNPDAGCHRRGAVQAAHLAQDPRHLLLEIAMLGGYLARNHDPPPGNMAVWRGLTRFYDIAFGLSIRTRRRCG